MEDIKFRQPAFAKELAQQTQFNDAYRHVATVERGSLPQRRGSPRKFTKKVVRLEQRDGRGKNELAQELRQKGIFMLDSSYTYAANPNTMRDFGPQRNAIYNVRAGLSSKGTPSEVSDTTSVYKSDLHSFHFMAVKKRDYTKNISESLFSPGWVQQAMVTRNAPVPAHVATE